MSNPREKGEQRLFGALLVVSSQLGDRVLAIKDSPKVEVSAGTAIEWWNRPANETVISFPGGGRGTNERGLQETLLETLKSEAEEELYGNITVPNNSHSFKREQQKYPFVVGQIKDDEVLNQFGVTSLHIPISYFNKESQRVIEDAVNKQIAFWIPFKWVQEVLNASKPQEEQFYGYRIRPQFLCAAMLWHLQMNNILNLNLLQNANRDVIRFIQDQSEELNLPIRNGTFKDNGLVKNSLPKRDRNFLGINKQ